MNCEAYAILLDKHLDGDITPAEREAMLRHEEGCPACAARRLEMEALRDDLASLRGDAPPMPEEFHSAWLASVKEDAMKRMDTQLNETNNAAEQPREATDTILSPKGKRRGGLKPGWKRGLAWAAALVFVIAGTAITRDNLGPRTTGGSAAKTTVATSAYRESAATGAAYYGMNAAAPMAAYEVEMVDGDVPMEMEEAAEFSADNGAPARQTKIIRTVSMTIVTRSFDDSLEQLRQRCEALGGSVSYSSVNAGGKTRTANLTLRVPSDRLDSFLQEADSAGRVTQCEENATDVTESYYDTKARLDTQQALLERLRALIGTSSDLSDLLELESKMADTQYSIDRLQASLNQTDSRVRDSTVTVYLREELETPQNRELTFGERLGNALRLGLEGLVEFLEDAALFLVAALPFIALAGAAVAVIAVIRRRRKTK